MNANDFEIGERVNYYGGYGQPENGVVKTKRAGDPSFVFVVYKCGGDWDNFANYTGQRTACSELQKGWVT